MVCTMSNDCQMVLVPVAAAPVHWEQNATAMGMQQTTNFQPMPMLVAAQAMQPMQPMQAMQLADPSSCGTPQEGCMPQQYSMQLVAVPMPAEMTAAAKMPAGSEETMLRDPHSLEWSHYTPSDTCSAIAAPHPDGHKPIVSASAARRQRRQRAAERVARARDSTHPALVHGDHPCTSTVGSSDGTSSDSEGPICGAEAAALEEMMTAIQAGGDGKDLAVSALHGSVWRLSRDPLGCRVVQAALERASASDAKALVAELHGHAEEAIYSPHANYVIQKIIEVMPTRVASFVAQELRGLAGSVSRHRFGCRIFCRLLEHSSGQLSGAAADLVNEVLVDAEDLVRHTFGHYVAKVMLEQGTAEQKQRLAQALRATPVAVHRGGAASGLLRNALHRNASYVLEKALTHCAAEDAHALAYELVAIGSVASLAMSPFGSHVVTGMLRIPDVEAMVYAQLAESAGHIRTNKYGSRLLDEVRAQ